MNFLGHESEHRRFGWRDERGRRRGFFARWRGDRWECCISGYSMRPSRFFAYTQSQALTEARLRIRTWGPSWQVAAHWRDLTKPWDARPDLLPTFASNVQLPLLELAA